MQTPLERRSSREQHHEEGVTHITPTSPGSDTNDPLAFSDSRQEICCTHSSLQLRRNTSRRRNKNATRRDCTDAHSSLMSTESEMVESRTDCIATMSTSKSDISTTECQSVVGHSEEVSKRLKDSRHIEHLHRRRKTNSQGPHLYRHPRQSFSSAHAQTFQRNNSSQKSQRHKTPFYTRLLLASIFLLALLNTTLATNSSTQSHHNSWNKEQLETVNVKSTTESTNELNHLQPERIPDLIAFASRLFQYQVPETLLSETILRYEANEAGRSSLPPWLHLDETTALLSGIPLATNVGKYYIFLETHSTEEGENGRSSTTRTQRQLFTIEVKPYTADINSATPSLGKSLDPDSDLKLDNSIPHTPFSTIEYSAPMTEGSDSESTTTFENVDDMGVACTSYPTKCKPTQIPTLANFLFLAQFETLSSLERVNLILLTSKLLGACPDSVFVRDIDWSSRDGLLLWSQLADANFPTIHEYSTVLTFIMSCESGQKSDEHFTTNIAIFKRSLPICQEGLTISDKESDREFSVECYTWFVTRGTQLISSSQQTLDESISQAAGLRRKRQIEDDGNIVAPIIVANPIETPSLSMTPRTTSLSMNATETSQTSQFTRTTTSDTLPTSSIFQLSGSTTTISQVSPALSSFVTPPTRVIPSSTIPFTQQSSFQVPSSAVTLAPNTGTSISRSTSLSDVRTSSVTDLPVPFTSMDFMMDSQSTFIMVSLTPTLSPTRISIPSTIEILSSPSLTSTAAPTPSPSLSVPISSSFGTSDFVSQTSSDVLEPSSSMVSFIVPASTSDFFLLSTTDMLLPMPTSILTPSVSTFIPDTTIVDITSRVSPTESEIFEPTTTSAFDIVMSTPELSMFVTTPGPVTPTTAFVSPTQMSQLTSSLPTSVELTPTISSSDIDFFTSTSVPLFIETSSPVLSVTPTTTLLSISTSSNVRLMPLPTSELSLSLSVFTPGVSLSSLPISTSEISFSSFLPQPTTTTRMVVDTITPTFSQISPLLSLPTTQNIIFTLQPTPQTSVQSPSQSSSIGLTPTTSDIFFIPTSSLTPSPEVTPIPTSLTLTVPPSIATTTSLSVSSASPSLSVSSSEVFTVTPDARTTSIPIPTPSFSLEPTSSAPLSSSLVTTSIEIVATTEDFFPFTTTSILVPFSPTSAVSQSSAIVGSTSIFTPIQTSLIETSSDFFVMPVTTTRELESFPATPDARTTSVPIPTPSFSLDPTSSASLSSSVVTTSVEIVATTEDFFSFTTASILVPFSPTSVVSQSSSIVGSTSIFTPSQTSLIETLSIMPVTTTAELEPFPTTQAPSLSMTSLLPTTTLTPPTVSSFTVMSLPLVSSTSIELSPTPSFVEPTTSVGVNATSSEIATSTVIEVAPTSPVVDLSSSNVLLPSSSSIDFFVPMTTSLIEPFPSTSSSPTQSSTPFSSPIPIPTSSPVPIPSSRSTPIPTSSPIPPSPSPSPTPIPACETTDCNNGTCIDLPPPQDFMCMCYPGWTGQFCDVDIDFCTPSPLGPCTGDGRTNACIDGNSTYTCVCSPGYTGVNCSIDINECDQSPCFNNATCVDGPAGTFTCMCSEGYTGTLCDIELDPCDPNPCKENQQCISLSPGEFSCIIIPTTTSITMTTMTPIVTMTTMTPSDTMTTVTPIVTMTTVAPSVIPTTSIRDVVSPTPTPTPPQNVPPVLLNPIGMLLVNEGQFFQFSVPELTFFDSESGNTDSLTLSLLDSNGNTLPNTTWVQLSTTSTPAIIEGLPLKLQLLSNSITDHIFLLRAQDEFGASAHDFVTIRIFPQDEPRLNLLTVFFEGNFILFDQNLSSKIEIVRGLASHLASEPDTNVIYIDSLESGSIAVTYHNLTIPDTNCSAFRAWVATIFVDLSYTETFIEAVSPFQTTSAAIVLGPCVTTGVNTTVTVGATPPRIDQNSQSELTILLATIIPTLSLAILCLLLGLLALVMYRRRRSEREELTILYPNEEDIFLRRRPVVLPGDVDLPTRRRRPTILPNERVVRGYRDDARPHRPLLEEVDYGGDGDSPSSSEDDDEMMTSPLLTLSRSERLSPVAHDDPPEYVLPPIYPFRR